MMKMKNKKIEIYPDRKNVYDRELKRLKESDLSRENKDIIMDFQNYLFSKGTGEQRTSKLMGQLRRIALHMDKDFEKATRKDVQSVIAYYNRQDHLAGATKADYRRAIKQFY